MFMYGAIVDKPVKPDQSEPRTALTL